MILKKSFEGFKSNGLCQRETRHSFLPVLAEVVAHLALPRCHMQFRVCEKMGIN